MHHRRLGLPFLVVAALAVALLGATPVSAGGRQVVEVNFRGVVQTPDIQTSTSPMRAQRQRYSPADQSLRCSLAVRAGARGD
jgi:hypothetical protein